VLYYWSPRGPARCEYPNKPEPLWDALPVLIPSIVDPEKIVAAYDADRDQVLWYYKAGVSSGNQLLVAYDVERDCFLGPDTDQGILVGCAGLSERFRPPPRRARQVPAGPPTTPTTTAVGSTAATANWVNGDTSVGVTTLIEYRVQGTTPWTTAGSASAGVTSLTITGLSGSTAYEWRASHLRNAQQSAFLGPVAGSQFTTSSLGTLLPPTSPAGQYIVPKTVDKALWTNSGESGVSTEVWYGYGSSTPSSFTLLATAGVGASSFSSTLGAPPGRSGHVVRDAACKVGLYAEPVHRGREVRLTWRANSCFSVNRTAAGSSASRALRSRRSRPADRGCLLDVETWDLVPMGEAGDCVFRMVIVTVKYSNGFSIRITPKVDDVALPRRTSLSRARARSRARLMSSRVVRSSRCACSSSPAPGISSS
jgi:hypothetical protein